MFYNTGPKKMPNVIIEFNTISKMNYCGILNLIRGQTT